MVNMAARDPPLRFFIGTVQLRVWLVVQLIQPIIQVFSIAIHPIWPKAAQVTLFHQLLNKYGYIMENCWIHL